MLTFMLVKETDDYKMFIFFSEGKEPPGLVVFYADGRRDLLVRPPSDPYKLYYSLHALNGIPRLGKDRGTVAWC